MTDPIKALIAAAKTVVHGFDCDDLSADGRKEMDGLIAAVAAAEARPDPAAEPSIVTRLRDVSRLNAAGDTKMALACLCDAVEALAREVRK